MTISPKQLNLFYRRLVSWIIDTLFPRDSSFDRHQPSHHAMGSYQRLFERETIDLEPSTEERSEEYTQWLREMGDCLLSNKDSK